MTWEANDATRCSARLGSGPVDFIADNPDALQCALAYDHTGGHVYISGSFVADRHGHE